MSLLIVSQGKLVAFYLNSSDGLAHSLAAIVASVAAYGLEGLRQALADLKMIRASDLDQETGPDDEDPFDDTTGLVHADLPQWLDRACRLAQSRGQPPIGLDEPLWGFTERTLDFSKAGLAGLLSPRQVIFPRLATFLRQAPLTATDEDHGYPFVVDLDRGTLEAWEEDYDAEDGQGFTYRLDLTGLEGWPAQELDGQVFALMHRKPEQQSALQAELNTEATGPALIQQGLDALAQRHPLTCLPSARRSHGPVQHYVWGSTFLKEQRDNAEVVPGRLSAETALFRFDQDDRGPRQVAGALRALIAAGLMPAQTLDHVSACHAPEGPYWLAVEEAPLPLCGTWRLMILGELLWRHQQVANIVPESHEDNGVDYLARNAFADAHLTDRERGAAYSLAPVARDALLVEQAVDALYGLDGARWQALPEGDATWTEEARAAALADLAQVLDRTLLVLVPVLYRSMVRFLAQVADHRLFQAVVAALPPAARARLDYLLAHPIPNGGAEE